VKEILPLLDDLCCSVESFLLLLSLIYTWEEGSERQRDEDKSLSSFISILLPYSQHSLSRVRIALFKAFFQILQFQQHFSPSWCPPVLDKILDTTIHCILFEENKSVVEESQKLWHVLIQFPPRIFSSIDFEALGKWIEQMGTMDNFLAQKKKGNLQMRLRASRHLALLLPKKEGKEEEICQLFFQKLQMHTSMSQFQAILFIVREWFMTSEEKKRVNLPLSINSFIHLFLACEYISFSFFSVSTLVITRMDL